MAMSNAERQAAYKRRLVERAERAERELAALKAGGAEPSRNGPSPDESAELETLRRENKRLRAELARVIGTEAGEHKVLVTRLRKQNTALKMQVRELKVAVLAARGATDGERSAANEALARMKGK
jgi:hypothetical protein